MKEPPAHQCRNCDEFPYIEMPGTPVTWTRSIGKFICTTCGEYISKNDVASHKCKYRINAFFMLVRTDTPAENDK